MRGARVQYSDEFKLRVKKMRASGMRLREISELLNISMGSVNYFVTGKSHSKKTLKKAKKTIVYQDPEKYVKYVTDYVDYVEKIIKQREDDLILDNTIAKV